MTEPKPSREAPLEDVIDPERPIIDPHHHLWDWPDPRQYMLPELWRDTGSGHNVQKTVFIECGAFYRTGGPEALRSVGETERVAQLAAETQNAAPGKPALAGIVAHTDLTQDAAALSDVLAAHREAGRGFLRGIRHAGARDSDPESLKIRGRGLERQYERDDFRRGVAQLGKLGLSYDTWHYHHQNQAYLALAQAVPDTVFVFDHFGTPLGVGRFAGKRDEIFERWKDDVAAIARCENVYAKLGGLAMPDNGFGWNERATRATSDELVAAQRRYYHHMLECFGPARCMFESNFPVDKPSIGYRSLWNAFKKLSADLSESEKHALFYGTAAKVYRL
ncbi:MAG: amidohydrolase family protein [Polyangiales bacterium]